MIVVPGWLIHDGISNRPKRIWDKDEDLKHILRSAKPFAVSKFEVTFDEWNTCVAYGECTQVSDGGWGHEGQPRDIRDLG